MQFLKQGQLRIWKITLEFWLCHLLSVHIFLRRWWGFSMVLLPCVHCLPFISYYSPGTIVRFKVLAIMPLTDQTPGTYLGRILAAGCKFQITYNQKVSLTRIIELDPEEYGNFLSHYPMPRDTSHCVETLPRGLEFSITTWPQLLRMQSRSGCSRWQLVLPKRFLRCWAEVSESAPGYAERGFTVKVNKVICVSDGAPVTQPEYLDRAISKQCSKRERGYVDNNWIYYRMSFANTEAHSKTLTVLNKQLSTNPGTSMQMQIYE